MSTINNRLTELELDQIAARYQSGRPDDILKLIDHIAAQDEILANLRAECAGIARLVEMLASPGEREET